MCWLMCGFVHVDVGAHGSQKRASDLLELGVTRSCKLSCMSAGTQTWVLYKRSYS